ncbi:MAG: hypothetical protein AAGM04_03010 [Pseudomonadota bacterium]
MNAKTAQRSGAGAGNSAIEKYFESTEAALDGLDAYLRDEDSPLYQHELVGAILSLYIEMLRQSFRAWKNHAAFSDKFRIGRAESGYPVFQHVLDLAKDATVAESRLKEMPSADDLREEMIDFILKKKKFPAPMQQAMAERLYLEDLQDETVFRPFVLPTTVKVSVNPKSGRPYYIVHWGSYDGSAHLPLCYIAVIEDSSDKMIAQLVGRNGKLHDQLDIPLPIEGLLNPELAHQFDDFCEKNSSYSLTLATIASNMDQDFPTLHPTQLRRVVMGPFYSSGVTQHGSVVTRILDKVSKADNAWMLTWTLQELFAISETPAKWGLWGSTPAKQTYHIDTDDLDATRMGVSAYEKHALIPHEAYQAVYASGERDAVFEGYRTHVVSSGRVLRDF